MGEIWRNKNQTAITTTVIAASFTFLYATVLAKLGRDWWSDENYSHGLLVPFVIAFIVWNEWATLKNAAQKGAIWLGGCISILAILLLFAGTLGAELFTTRISLVMMLAGIIIYLYGTKILRLLCVPFALLLLSIPIPQIVFNRIAFPLQIWASQMAVWGIRLFEVPTARNGNVIDILPRGSTQTISLEVVEACSGIRSLMTLVTLALILAYFTRRYDGKGFAGFSTADFWRAVVLMIAAVPIAVMTNAARVTATGVFTYYYGKQATDGTIHEISGWFVYVAALGLLLAANFLLQKIFGTNASEPPDTYFELRTQHSALRTSKVLLLLAILITGGITVNWFSLSGESDIARRPLSEMSANLGEWRQKGDEIKFDSAVENVLRATDYTMREYTMPDGRIANIYVGYYASQRSGATYHSPQNCLPGAGWVMKDPQDIEITTSTGRSFKANRFIIENGIYREVMIYWYQGRGRIEASEYRDKMNTIFDSISRSRSDGAIVRVMTSVGSDEPAAVHAAAELSSHLADNLTPFVPE
ncbi:MAG: exosortase C-terminal domain/associated protein EpsI [Pyrinomonadaceae bacterium]